MAILVTEADLIITRRTGISGLKAIELAIDKDKVENGIRSQELRDRVNDKKKLKLVLLDYLTNLPRAREQWSLHRTGARRRKRQL